MGSILKLNRAFKLRVLFSVTQRTDREGQHSRNKKYH